MDFSFEPSYCVPYRDKAVLERVRNIKREDLEKHPNPYYRIKVFPDDEFELIFLADMFYRIKQSDDTNTKVVMIMPNPSPTYKKLAYLINKFKVNCRNVHIFIMDEWADQDGRIAPETYPQGFMHAFKNYFYANINEKLRPPCKQIHGPTTENITYYSKMIEDEGEADICYSGPGWTGHLAFIEPNSKEFEGSLDDFINMGARVVTLNALTIAQNSLHGSFGLSGDIANVPPKAASIGPRDALKAKARLDMHGIATAGTFVSWQRMIARLVMHGPVTPQVPTSVLQLAPTDVIVSETIAADIEPNWNIQY
ncbi:MAG: hypothetical protein LLF89_02580 [Spirochaetaceae bacterium]|nr:hypothetical protein [Spirochaetaceae bacterium]